MTSASVTVRVDSATKKEASRIAEDFGFDLSTATRAFYKQIVREQRIPLTLEYPQPNAESAKAIQEADAMIAKGKPRFANADEMFAALEI